MEANGAHPQLVNLGDPYYFLNGELLYAGVRIELLTDDGSWVSGRYGFAWDGVDPDSIEAYAQVGDESIPIHETTMLRRPRSS